MISSLRLSKVPVLCATLAVSMLASVAFASSAVAGNLYVANYEGNTVSVIDGKTNQTVGTIQTGAGTGPWTLAIAPDGKTVYVANYDNGTISTIDTATNQVVGAPITTPFSTYGMTIAPNGTRGYVASTDDDTVVAIDLQTRQVIGAPINVSSDPWDVIVTPDGSRAYIVCSNEVLVLDLATNQIVGAPIPVEGAYLGSISPDGKFVYLGNYIAGSVTVIDTATNQVTPPIATGGQPEDVAVSPDGKRAYVSDNKGNGIITVDTATRQVVGSLFPVSLSPEYLAVSPDGRKVFTNGYNEDAIAGLDTSSNQLIGPILTGERPGQLAFVPDQSPTASIALPAAKARPGVPATLSGVGSSDPDGTVSTFAWQFGDGATESGANAAPAHTYGKPGEYPVTLTVTDNEGCSVPMVYTGHTAYCHGSPAATQTQTVKVAYPGVKVKCPKKAGSKGCKFKLKAVKKTGKGKEQKLKAQSAVAKVKVKAGKSKIVSLKPTKKFAKKLATAKKMLVEQKVTIDGETTTKVTKLKVVQ